MQKPFDHIVQKLSEISEQLKNCRDPEKRRTLLLEMRLYLDEAQHIASRPPQLPDVLRE